MEFVRELLGFDYQHLVAARLETDESEAQTGCVYHLMVRSVPTTHAAMSYILSTDRQSKGKVQP